MVRQGKVLSENLSWDVAILGNKLAMDSFIEKNSMYSYKSKRRNRFYFKCGEAQTSSIIFKNILYCLRVYMRV